MNLEFAHYTLANGIRLIVKENHHAQSVVIRGRLAGGGNDDPPDKSGLAAFTTSLMRRGTETRSFAEINEVVESVGASVYMSCGRHLLTFGSKSLAEDFDLMVDLIADNLHHPTFPDAEIERMRGQLITSLKEMEDSPRSMASLHFRESLYGPHHPYGRPFNGTVETVNTFTQDDCLSFYRRFYPQGGMMVVVGDVDSEIVYQKLNAGLGQWQTDSTTEFSPAPIAAPLGQIITHRHPMPSKSQADVVLGSVGPTRLADDYYIASVGDTILGHLGLGGRIGRVVRDEGGMAYYARSALAGGLGSGPWYVYAGVNPENIEPAIKLMLGEIQRLREEPVTAQELADAKSYLTGILPLQMESNEGVASMLLQMQLFNLGDDFISRYPDIINAVTESDIQAAAQRYLSDEVYALSIAGPVEA